MITKKEAIDPDELEGMAATLMAAVRALQLQEPTGLSELEKVQRQTEIGRALAQAIEVRKQAKDLASRERLTVRLGRKS